MDIQTKNEKQNFIGLLLSANLLGLSVSLALLLWQWFTFPQNFGTTWTFLVLIAASLVYLNYRSFRNQFNAKTLWQWLKNHQ